MKKAIIPAALLLAAVGAAQAQSSYQIYGLLDLSVGKSVFDDYLGKHEELHSGGDDGSSQGNSTSRFGIKGSADLGTGWKANFNLQSNGITSRGDIPAPFFARQAWVGLSNTTWGEFRFGRQDSVAFQTMIDFDFNGASNGISAMGYANAAPWGRGRQARALNYISPTYGGFKVQLGYANNEDPTLVGAEGNRDVFSGAVSFSSGPFAAAATVESMRVNGGAKFGSVSASYDLTFAKFAISYTDGAIDEKGVALSVVAPVAGFNVGAIAVNNTDTKGNAYELFINKEIFKSTIAYAEVGYADKKTQIAPKSTGYAVGLIFIF